MCVSLTHSCIGGAFFESESGSLFLLSDVAFQNAKDALQQRQFIESTDARV